MSNYEHRGRPKEYEQIHVMDAAMLSFWQKGYDGCSLNDLLDATGLSKSSLYQGFGNKKQVFLIALEHYSKRETTVMLANISSAKTGLQFFENLVDSFVSKSVPHWKSGCLIANTASEFGQNDPEIGAALKKSINNFALTFARAINKGQEDGSITKEQSPEDLGHYLIIALNGLRTMTKAGMSDTHIRKAGQMILTILT